MFPTGNSATMAKLAAAAGLEPAAVKSVGVQLPLVVSSLNCPTNIGKEFIDV